MLICQNFFPGQLEAGNLNSSGNGFERMSSQGLFSIFYEHSIVPTSCPWVSDDVADEEELPGQRLSISVLNFLIPTRSPLKVLSGVPHVRFVVDRVYSVFSTFLSFLNSRV